MKKMMAMTMSALLAASVMTAAAGAEEIKVWVADAVVDFTNQQAEAFKEAYPEFMKALWT